MNGTGPDSTGRKNIGFKVCRNNGNSFVMIGNYRNTIHNYEDTIISSIYQETGISEFVILCRTWRCGKSKRCFTKIMSLPLNQVGEGEGNSTSERNNWKWCEIYGDLLEEYLFHHSKSDEQVVIKEYMIVFSVFGEENWADVYCLVCIHLKGTHESLSKIIEIEQSAKHLKKKEFD